MIKFNSAVSNKKFTKYILDSVLSGRVCGDNSFTKRCNEWFEGKFNVLKCLLTTSCTHSLEMSAILCDIKSGDEVIMPSYTFVSTANAFVLRGAKIVFIDVRPDTMNIDEGLIESAITERTRAIVPVHYAGVSCEMDKIIEIARKYNLFVIEDAAQAMMSKYNNRFLGSIGDFGCFSFHETKNYTMGEGGAIIINNKDFIERSEIIREKGTNRSKFIKGEIDKYSWVDIGSSYLPSDINSAFLYGQLEFAEEINKRRLKLWDLYYSELQDLKKNGKLELQHVPKNCMHNAHMFYIKLKNIKIRERLIEYLKIRGILSVFHYIPLHSSLSGRKFSRFNGDDVYTTRESEKILRLPLYYDLKESDVEFICHKIKDFFSL